MEGLRRAAMNAVKDVKRHAAVIGISVALTAALRWVAWVVAPMILIGIVYACWRHGIRVVIDRTGNRKEPKEC